MKATELTKPLLRRTELTMIDSVAVWEDFVKLSDVTPIIERLCSGIERLELIIQEQQKDIDTLTDANEFEYERGLKEANK